METNNITFTGPKFGDAEPIGLGSDSSLTQSTEEATTAEEVVNKETAPAPKETVAETPKEPIKEKSTEAPNKEKEKEPEDDSDLYYSSRSKSKDKSKESKEGEGKQADSEELKTWKQKGEQFDSILQDDFIKDYLELKQSPDFSFDDFVGQFSKPNLEGWSEEKIFKSQFDTKNFTDEEIEDAWSEFEELPSYKKKQELLTLKEKLKSQMAPNGKDYSALMKGKLESQKKQQQEYQEKQQKVIQDTTKYIDTIEGKSVMGYTLTKEDVAAVRDMALNGGGYYDEKGNFDHEKYVIDMAAVLVRDKAAERIKEMGKAEFWKERHNPSKSTTVSTKQSSEGSKEREKAGFKSAFSLVKNK